MSKTVTLTKSAVSDCVKLLPRQVTETYTSSVTFMKQLTTIAVGTILHMKNLFPEDTFIVEKFNGLNVWTLKKQCKDEMAHFVSTALMKTYDAFDKKYVEQLAICFYEGECKAENLVEYYMFEYSYLDEDIAMNIRRSKDGAPHTVKCTFDNIKKKTEQMIQACVVFVKTYTRNLPKGYDISLRLYYNQDAPKDYQAPGFESPEEEYDYLEPTLHETVNVGDVATPFHGISTYAYIKEDANYSHEAIATQNPPAISQMDYEIFDVECSSQEKLNMEKRKSHSNLMSINCPCLTKTFDEEADDAVLVCQYCGGRQHALCFGVLGGSAPMWSEHCCVSCHDTEPTTRHTDSRLAQLDPQKRTTLCEFRRVLELCTRVSDISADDLIDKFRLSTYKGNRFMRLLGSHKIVDKKEHSDPDTRQLINRQELKRVISAFFHINKDDIVGSLIAETLTSGSTATNNPLDEVLSPIEKENIQNDSIIGNVVPAKPTNKVIDDTLKEYREAIDLLNKTNICDLPLLSGSHSPMRAGKRPLVGPTDKTIGTKKSKRSRLKDFS